MAMGAFGLGAEGGEDVERPGFTGGAGGAGLDGTDRGMAWLVDLRSIAVASSSSESS